MSCKKILVKNKEDVEVRIINNVDIRIINLMLGEFVDVNACIKQDNNYTIGKIMNKSKISEHKIFMIIYDYL